MQLNYGMDHVFNYLVGLGSEALTRCRLVSACVRWTVQSVDRRNPDKMGSARENSGKPTIALVANLEIV